MKLDGTLMRHEEGQVSLTPDELEDLWLCYNLIVPGDSVKTSTMRKVTTESSSGSVTAERRTVNLTLCVESTEFDAQGAVIRVKGQNLTECAEVKLHAYHTSELFLHHRFTLAKHSWDSVALDMISDACNPTNKADVAAVVLQEGLAHVCLLTNHLTLSRARIEVQIPRKRGAEAAGRKKAMERFFSQIKQAVFANVDPSTVRVLIVAGTDVIRESFLQYWETEAQHGVKQCQDLKKILLPCYASSGHKHALKEVLLNPSVMQKLTHTKASDEILALERFMKQLASENEGERERVVYGPTHVFIAADRGAIATLMVCDNLFRSQNIETRKKYIELVDRTKEMGGEVKIFSSQHVTGEQLQTLSGVAAFLRFPITDVDDLIGGSHEAVDDDDEEGKKEDDLEDELAGFL